MSEVATARDYDRWLRGRSFSAISYELMAGVPGAMLINTPAYRLHERLALRPDQRLLDVGCGRASLLQILGARARFTQPPVGIDVSIEMLRRAVNDQRGAATSADLVQAAATALPFSNAAFDVAICSYVVKHLDDAALRRFFAELLRVLKSGGFALVWEFAPTGSRLVNRWNRWLITRGVHECHLRGRTALTAAAIEAGFAWVDDAGLRPFLVPPIPRVSLVMGKAEDAWRARTGPGRAHEQELAAQRERV